MTNRLKSRDENFYDQGIIPSNLRPILPFHFFQGTLSLSSQLVRIKEITVRLIII